MQNQIVERLFTLPAQEISEDRHLLFELAHLVFEEQDLLGFTLRTGSLRDLESS